MRAAPEWQRDLVLVGGGHAHVLAIRRLAMRPLPAGSRVSLISPDSHTPYSGMLPGLVAGHYRFEDCHIDLRRLCDWAGVRFLQARVQAWDPAARRLQLIGRADVEYDLLSLDIGSEPSLDAVPGAREHAIAVKPVADFFGRWQQSLSHVADALPVKEVAVVGAGAGGVELVLAMAHRLAQHPVRLNLLGRSAELLPGYSSRARLWAERALAQAGVQVHLGAAVAEAQAGRLRLEDGRSLKVDEAYWCTAAGAAPWVAEAGLPCDDRGFLSVQPSLQSLQDARVFAAGDIAHLAHAPCPKSGVYAVRQGPILGANLRQALESLAQGQEPAAGLRPYVPQKRFLSIVSLGGQQAVAQRGPWALGGAWVWGWKDRIDRRFMRLFSDLPTRQMAPPAAPAEQQSPCGGCGAKVGANALGSVLSALHSRWPQHALAHSERGDVSALRLSGPGLQSIDSLRPMIDDPWRMGRIAAQHALSDLYAAGALPASALAHVVLPFSNPSMQRRELSQVLDGMLSALAQADCPLLGGHSLQGPELQLGLVVNGCLPPGQAPHSKSGGQAGDRLILTRPLGTGVIFAAAMQGRADGRVVEGALRQMEQGNGMAAAILAKHPLRACTDVTGFGLLGHLREMLRPGLGARLWGARIPLLEGAAGLSAQGLRSTAWEANTAAAGRWVLEEAAAGSQPGHSPGAPCSAMVDLLFDPQTGGGLLLALPEQASGACLQALQDAGLPAAEVGLLENDPDACIRVLWD